MHLYLAGLGSSKRAIEFVLEFNKEKPFEEQIGVMCSFAAPRLVDKVIGLGFKKIFLDSGAFSVFKSGLTVDIDSLADFIKDYQTYLTAYISLDVISDKIGVQSLANWKYLKEVKGLDKILPVYHAGEKWSVFREYCNNSDYVCLGGMAGISSRWTTWVPFLSRVFEEFPDKKYHALGVNDIKLIQRFPFYSCDALSWRSGSRFGQVITPYGRWWISERNQRKISEIEANTIQIKEWLASKGISYPLPKDFDFNELDELNILSLYEFTVDWWKGKDFELILGVTLF